LKSSCQQTAKTTRHGAPDTPGDRVKTMSEKDFARKRHLLAVCRSTGVPWTTTRAVI